MIDFFLILIYLLLYFVRSLRWLAIFQQKEYRWDRIWTFLRSIEGMNEIKTLINIPKGFKKSEIKRPKITMRIMAIGGIFAVLSFALFFLNYFLYILISENNLSKEFASITYVVFMCIDYVMAPFVLWLATLPTSQISLAITYYTLQKASVLFQKHKPKVIGITGSYGKTSTKLLLKHVLSQKFDVFATQKSFNTRYSIAKNISQEYKGEEFAIIEYAAYTKGEIKFLTKWFPPDVAIITGITSQHLELFGTVEDIIKAKSELICALTEDADVFVNTGDDRAEEVSRVGGREDFLDGIAPIFSIDKGKKTKVVFSSDKNGYILINMNGRIRKTKIFGRHYIQNLCMVMNVALSLGMDLEMIINAVISFKTSEQFVKTYEMNSKTLVIDDGSTCNPKGFIAAIDLVKNVKRETKILLTSGIVDLGIESAEVHTNLAEKADGVFDKVMYVGVDGEREFMKIFKDRMISNRNELIKYLKKLGDKDVVLIEGKIKKDILQYLK